MIRTALPHKGFWASVLLSSGLASIALFGGLGLQAVRSQLLSFTPLIIALPAMNAMAGDYVTLIAGHIGDPQLYRQRLKKLLISLVISVPISIFGVTTMSLFIAYRQGFDISRTVLVTYVFLVTVSLILILLISVGAIFAINKALLNHKINSDDVLIPLANTLASVLVLISFALIAIHIR